MAFASRYESGPLLWLEGREGGFSGYARCSFDIFQRRGDCSKKGGFFNMFNNEPIRLGFRSFGEIHLALSVKPTLRGAT